jgi:serine phosphatase RsbU (regulator of sigma subunit)/anti-sigma regulatory factor (Ser/Thr protein kinase)
MTTSEPTPRAPADAVPGTADRDRLLASAARRVMRELDASAVTVYLRVPGSSTLAAAVVTVTPLGVGTVERVPMGDKTYASAVAFATGEIATAYSVEEVGGHPDLAVIAPFPYTVTAAPLCPADGCVGTLTAFWPQAFRDPSDEERRFLEAAARDLSDTLEALAAAGVSLEHDGVPMVIPPERGGAGPRDRAAPDSVAERTAPLMYHLHKLAVYLTSTAQTEQAAHLALERTMAGFDAQAMAITLIEADRLHVIAVAGCSREFLRTLNGMPLGIPLPEAEAIARMRQLVIPPGDESTRGRTEAGGPEGEDCTWVVLPLVAGGRAVGTCSIAFHLKERVIIAEQAVLTALATLLGQTLERTQLYDAQYALAQKLQQALLPRMLPQSAGLLSTSRYVPTAGGIELGGDWYDLIRLPDGAVAAVIGDVQGHNIAAAVVMGQLRSAVRAYVAEGHDPATVLNRTNQLLLDLDSDRFATCCCLRVDPTTGAAQLVCAGQPPPLIRTAEGHYLGRGIDIGVPMGIQPEPGYRSTEFTLPPGALIILYTDGLVGSERELTVHAVEDVLRESGEELETLGDRLMEGTSALRSRSDDAALLLLRYEGLPANGQRYVRHIGLQRRDLQGVHRTRVLLREWLRVWELPSMAEEAELLASEVVTNALVHGDSDVSVYVRKYPERIRVEVRDSDPHPAAPVNFPRAEDQAEDGRGLMIVSTLASSWGNSPSGRGKTVWFELPITSVNGHSPRSALE